MAGLDPDKKYKVHELNRIDYEPLDCEGKSYTGAYLMNNGIEIPYKNKVHNNAMNDWSSRILYLREQ